MQHAPRTPIDDAVERVITHMRPETRDRLLNLVDGSEPFDHLTLRVRICGDMGLGMWVRELLNLWRQPPELFASLPLSNHHPDSASLVILVECWRRLKFSKCSPFRLTAALESPSGIDLPAKEFVAEWSRGPHDPMRHFLLSRIGMENLAYLNHATGEVLLPREQLDSLLRDTWIFYHYGDPLRVETRFLQACLDTCPMLGCYVRMRLSQ